MWFTLVTLDPAFATSKAPGASSSFDDPALVHQRIVLFKLSVPWGLARWRWTINRLAILRWHARAVGSVRVEPRGKYKRGLGRRREREQERPWNKDNWARRNNDTGSQL